MYLHYKAVEPSLISNQLPKQPNVLNKFPSKYYITMMTEFMIGRERERKRKKGGRKAGKKEGWMERRKEIRKSGRKERRKGEGRQTDRQ